MTSTTKPRQSHARLVRKQNFVFCLLKMRYCIDLDGTLCSSCGGDYAKAKVIPSRVDAVNRLHRAGHHICIWTARGARSGTDWQKLTEEQLARWGVEYDELDFRKRDFDRLIDDKAFNVEQLWRIPEESTRSTQASEVPKGWGREIVFVNNDHYCGKILCFDAGKKFSMHFHLEKLESWYVAEGEFLFNWIDTAVGQEHTEHLKAGDVITNERGAPHQLEALTRGKIFEVSTPHADTDSYRVRPGDSQDCGSCSCVV